MKTTMTLPFLLALGLFGSSASAQDQPKSWLKGMTAAKVKISMSQALVDAGVQGARLRTQIELRLRNAGLRVDPSLTQPVLYVEITAVRGPGTNAFASYVNVQVSEDVKVARNGQDVFTIIWGPNLHVLYTVRDLENELFVTTTNKIDEFLNDWLGANPR